MKICFAQCNNSHQDPRKIMMIHPNHPVAANPREAAVQLDIIGGPIHTAPVQLPPIIHKLAISIKEQPSSGWLLFNDQAQCW
jgi:hypothetical protein